MKWKEDTESRRRDNECSAFQAELLGIKMRVDWIRQGKIIKFYSIHIDLLAALLAIANRKTIQILALEIRAKEWLIYGIRWDVIIIVKASSFRLPLLVSTYKPRSFPIVSRMWLDPRSRRQSHRKVVMLQYPGSNPKPYENLAKKAMIYLFV